ncbi:MAG: ABC transporter substrate-binding protein [Rhodosalinus sp.]|uniref:ABC transporter substrate-binding protein n=1 Tax=Rhodosalinus sp. TaxID=2047741 RepID=UPI0039795883
MTTPFSFAGRAAAAVVAAALAAPAVQSAELGDTDDPIRFALVEWTGQHLTSRIIGSALEEMGYDVEYVSVGYLVSGTAAADGDVHATLEVWDNNLGDLFPQLLESGRLENLGDVGLEAGEGWMYPDHVAELCPGLPSWEAVQDCAQEFATAETFPQGRFLSYPSDWSNRSEVLIEGEDLDYRAVPAGSEGALVAELKAAAETDSPLLMMFWAPHWVLSEVDVSWVDMPDEIREEYSITQPNVFKAVWPGLKDKWPAAYEVIRTAKITNEIQEPLMARIDRDGEDTKAVVAEWMAANEDIWRPWIEDATD